MFSWFENLYVLNNLFLRFSSKFFYNSYLNANIGVVGRREGVNLPPHLDFFCKYFPFLTSYWLAILWLYIFFFYKQNDKKIYIMLNVRTGGCWYFVLEHPIFTYFLTRIINIYCNNKRLRNFDKCNKWSQTDIFVLKKI